MKDSDISKWELAAKEFALFSQYDSFKKDFLYPLILKEIGDIKGRKILDLGCSSGELSRILSSSGAKVTAIDASENMIKIARGKESGKINYIRADLNKKIDLPSESFNLVIAAHVLMDIENYQTVIKEVYRLLKPGGKLVVSIPHPCFTPPVMLMKRGLLGRLNLNWSSLTWKSYFINHKIDKYLVKGFPTSHFHRSLENYLNEIIKSGFEITSFCEPAMPQKIIKKTRLFSAMYFPNTVLFTAQK